MEAERYRRLREIVLAAGERETGVTVHLVDEAYDQGPIIAQHPVPVRPDDTAESLAARVLAAEHELYPAVLQRIATGEIDLDAEAQKKRGADRSTPQSPPM